MELTVVTPTFNEADNVERFLGAVSEVLRGIGHEIVAFYGCILYFFGAKRALFHDVFSIVKPDSKVKPNCSVFA